MADLVRRMSVVFVYQSQHIRFNEWIELITLCLAPLIAHIIVGVPHATFLDQKRPRWHQIMSLYNPTSVMWRYFAIFDRRIRARSWNAFDMAASNAVFWTSHGWDGSEEMIKKSREHCLRKPAKKHIDLFSGTAAKTLIITLQGVQAIYTLALGVSSPETNKYADIVALHYIFVPLAIVGLLRLLAAYWLTEDYHFAHVESHKPETEDKQGTLTEVRPGLETEYSSASLLRFDTAELQSSFHPVKSWRGILTRTLFLLLLLPLWGITAYYITPFNGTVFTATTLLVNLFYLCLLTGTILILFISFCSGQSETTIIPYVSSIWYQLYSCFLVIFVVTIIVVSGLQTRRTPCGRYTTYPMRSDWHLCPDLFNQTSEERFNSTSYGAADLRRFLA